MQRPAAAAAGQATGDGKQPATQGAGGAHRLAGQADHGAPAQQVVRQAGDHRPGAVGREDARGEVRQGLAFQVADGELKPRRDRGARPRPPPEARRGW